MGDATVTAEERQREPTRREEDRPGQRARGSPGGSGRPTPEEEPDKKEESRPETLPPAATSGGLPSEPGWMRP